MGFRWGACGAVACAWALACAGGGTGGADASDADASEADAATEAPGDTAGEPGDASADPGGPEAAIDAVPKDATPEEVAPLSCNFDYDFPAWSAALTSGAEPRASATWLMPVPGSRDAIVMPDFQDDMPLFERAEDWGVGTRCFELPTGAALLSEEEAWAMYRRVAETTTGGHVDATPGRRTVLGIRGAYPGTFAWNGNEPNRFNDTLVLLWRDEADEARVLEFAGHTDTGAHVFQMASSLWPDRRYDYRCGWHNDFNAIEIVETGYRVRDDANSNGHWDSDRNGWLPPLGDKDFDRAGSEHNIHVASVDRPLETAEVDNWSAGCQTIPGMASWTRFIENAWTQLDDPVDYFLVDARDIPSYAWIACTPDGSHQCPYRIGGFPFHATGNTIGWPVSVFDVYNCSTADESGPEVVWVFTTQTGGTVTATVDDVAGDDGPDVDVHLLMADDPKACLARGNVSAAADVPPGRYFVVVDTYVDGGTPLPGAFTLDVTFDPAP